MPIKHRDLVIFNSNIVTSYDSFTTGTKITNERTFNKVLGEVIFNHNFDNEEFPGQAVIELPIPTDDFPRIPHPSTYLSSGIGLRSGAWCDYVIRHRRGKVELFLKREFAIPVENAAIVVYTRDAYFADPEMDQKERDRIASLEETWGRATHFLVIILAPSSPLTPYRLVANLAGANNEVQVWDAKTIRKKAHTTIAFYNKYCVVSD